MADTDSPEWHLDTLVAYHHQQLLEGNWYAFTPQLLAALDAYDAEGARLLLRTAIHRLAKIGIDPAKLSAD